jgi:superfamily II DNA or RNA helicase
MVVSNLGDVTRDARPNAIKRWSKNGGVLLVSDKTLVSIASTKKGGNGLLTYLQPDVVVMDEAHTMLRNSSSKVYQTLSALKTLRRIGEYL